MRHRVKVGHRYLAGITAAALLVTQVALPPRVEAAHLGSSTASAGSAPPPGVTAIESFQPDLFTGRATTAVPLVVPPGRKGMQPSLALGYSSSGRNGWVGVGWGLDVGYIERSTKQGVPRYDSSDTYTFMFQGVSSDLVQVPGGTYRAKDEGLFLKFEHQGVSGWEVRDKSGTRYLFGQTAASQIESLGQVFRWCLDKVIDPNGNSMTMTYTKDRGQLYLAQIRYTGHESSTQTPANQVDFLLENRPKAHDIETSYRSGFPVTTAKRLAAIETRATVNGILSLARRYELAYTTSGRTDRSLLTRITQVGTDGTTSLLLSTFAYQHQDTPTYQVSAITTAPSSVLLSGDVDGNGTSDPIIFTPASGTWSVSVVPVAPGTPPWQTWRTGFGATSSIPLVGDWDGDGRADVAIYESGSWQFATSTGATFQTGTIAPLTFGDGTPLVGDFNGDGRVDVGTHGSKDANAHWKFALNTGSGFSSTNTSSYNWATTGFEPLTGDFNGDGLTDIAVRSLSNGDVKVQLSLGTTFIFSGTWLGGLTHSVTIADVDGDGTSDLAYYDRAIGQVVYYVSTGPGGVRFFGPNYLATTFSLRTANDQLQVADFNGDALADPAVFNVSSGATEVATSQGSFPDLVSNLANGLGGSSTIEYQPSSQCDNICPIELVPKLPFVIPVVNRVTVSDGFGNSYTTSYFYTRGRYDAAAKEFRGFGRVEARDVDSNVSITEFHQDEHKKGRPIRTEFRDGSANLWTKTEQTWSCIDPFPGVHFAKLDQTDSFTYDGDATFRQTRARFSYDGFGNLIRADEDGEPAIAGDERATTTQFVLNPSVWILNTPSLTQTLDASGSVVSQRRFYYDGAATLDAAPTAGRLTKEEEWLFPNPANPLDPAGIWQPTTLTYDPSGNVASVTDALGRTTTNTYDPTGTYLTIITNTLTHTRQLAYDPRFGAVTRSTDQNEVTTTTEYDALGRVTKVIGPTDTAALPTVSYEYDLSTVPARTSVHSRVQSGQPQVLTVHTFTDGLGRTIQTRSPAEDPTKQVVTGAVEFNARGQVVRQWVPYLDVISATYRSHTLVTGLASPVSYGYDPLGRALTVTDPDGSVSATSYDDWTITSTDAKGSRTRRSSDAYGRLVRVEELNGADTYTTTYAYDALGNLTQVTDAQGHLTRITYDSLGRKLTMDDPDMGRWTYAYDAVDNLVSQTDARGVGIGFTYDALNRLTQKSYTIPNGSGITNPGTVTYTYDNPVKPFAKGKLTEITDGSGSSSFEYDTLGRLIQESKTIDGATSTISRAYDLLGRLTTLTYHDNDVAAYTYNVQGGLESVDLEDALTLARTPVLTAVDYNAAGQLTRLTLGNGTVSDYTYDPQTLRLSQLRTTGPAGTVQDFRYTFDPVGNVTGITDRVNTATQTFQYDPLHRLTQAIGSYGTQTFRYDGVGNLLEKAGVSFSYGRTPPTSDAGASPHAVTATSPLSPALGGDLSARVPLALTYDANGNLTAKTPSVTPGDPLALLAQTFSYDAENRLVEVKAPPTHTASFTFQSGWNLVDLPVIPEDSSINALLPNFTQDFEQVARVIATGEVAGSTTYAHYVGDVKFDDFSSLEYGVSYQVYCKAASPVTISVTGKLPSQGLTRPLAASWHLLPVLTLASTSPTQAFGSVDYDQLKGYDTASSSLTTPTTVEPGQSYWVHVASASTFSPPLPKDPTTRFVYDGDGGRVKQTTAAGTTTFLGELVEKAPDSTTTKYVFAGSQRIASITRTPQQQAAWRERDAPTTGPRRLARLAQRAWSSLLAFLDVPTAEAAGTPTIRFFHGDHLGSTNLVTDATGAVVERTEHSPFGSVASAWSLEPRGRSRIGFTGQREDAGTGLILFPARAYDPDLGRFLQPDPFVQDPSDPQTLNRYAYVRNNPVVFVDPSGYGWLRRLLAIVVAAVATILVPEGAGVWWTAAAGVAGAAAGDQTGAAIERSRSDTSPALPTDTGQRFWNAVGPPLLAAGQQLSRAAHEVQALPEKASELSEEVWNEAQRIVAELGVSAGRAAYEVGNALARPLRNAYDFQTSFGPLDAYTLRTFHPSPTIKGKLKKGSGQVAFGGNFTVLGLESRAGRLETSVSFDELNAKFAAGLGKEVKGLLIDFSATVVNGQNEYRAFSIFGREIVLSYEVGWGAGFKLTFTPSKFKIGFYKGPGRSAGIEIR